ELRRITARALDEVRRFARGLRPSALDELGLVAALEHSAAHHAEGGGITIAVEGPSLDVSRLPPAVETALYRIVQEALANAVTHGKPNTVHVVIRREAGRVQAIVADDGRGFDVEAALKAHGAWTRLGLHGMRERAGLLNGSVTIESTPGEGTTVYIDIPLDLSGPPPP
ncbi:MAG: sensor histidine kinase, partial [Candidatus Rokuibacteriota bacterium]